MKRQLFAFAFTTLAGALPACSQQGTGTALPQTTPPEITINDTRVGAENLAASQDGTVFFGSMSKGTIYRALPGAALADAWIGAQDNGLVSVAGVLAHDKSNTLWVCTTTHFRRGTVETPAVQTALRAFDLKTGVAKGTYPFPGGGLGNDVAIATDGTAYTTDTMGGRVLRLRPGTEALEVWVTDPSLRGVDGVSLLADGMVYVNNVFNGKLLRIAVNGDGTAGPIAELETSLPFSRPDGLRTSGPKTLLQAEGSGRLTEITIEGGRGQVRVIKEGLNRATGVTQVGTTAVVLVEGSKAVLVPLTAPDASAPLTQPAPATEPEKRA